MGRHVCTKNHLPGQLRKKKKEKGIYLMTMVAIWRDDLRYSGVLLDACFGGTYTLRAEWHFDDDGKF